ncbi:MAG: metallophosphoesterase family protein [Magnetospirillum sp.]|nr:metallophosphoesterase family protein [Magnetospirillum sp.]
MSDLPHILFAGDPHADFRLIVRAALARKPDCVVLLGDCDLARPLHVEMKPVIDAGIPIHWIPGNHDYDTEAFHDHLFLSDIKKANLHRRISFAGKLSMTGLGGVKNARAWDDQDRPVHKTRADLLPDIRMIRIIPDSIYAWLWKSKLEARYENCLAVFSCDSRRHGDAAHSGH